MKRYLIILSVFFSTLLYGGACSEYIGGSSSGWLSPSRYSYSIENSSRTSSRKVYWIKVNGTNFDKFINPYKVSWNYSYHGKKGGSYYPNKRHSVSYYGSLSSASAGDGSATNGQNGLNNYAWHARRAVGAMWNTAANKDRGSHLNIYLSHDRDARNGDWWAVHYNPPIKSSSNRYIMLTERNMNNGQRAVAMNSAGGNMGKWLHISSTQYANMGVKVAIGSGQQKLGARVAPLTSLVPAGTLIYGIRVYQKDVRTSYPKYGDGADGKVLMMAKYVGCTIDAVNDSPSKFFTGGFTTGSFLNNDNADQGVKATSSNVFVSLVSRGGLPVGTKINAKGEIYIAKGAVNGTYPVKYKICLKKDKSFCDTATVNIKIRNEINAVDDYFSGSYISGGLTPSLLSNDTASRFVSSYSLPRATLSNVTLSLVSLGGLPAGTTIYSNKIKMGGFVSSGNYNPKYKICLKDVPSVCDTATVYIKGRNYPVANSDSIIMKQDETSKIDVLANDTHPDPSENLSIIYVGKPAHGKAVIKKVNGKQIVEYTPNSYYYGSDVFTYTVSDNYGNKAQAKVNITVTQIPPLGSFEQFYTKNVKGNLLFFGNSSVRGVGALTNNYARLYYNDIDKDSSTFNSSSVTIPNKVDGVPINNAKIIWAGIFWQGHLHNDWAEKGIDSEYQWISHTKSTAANQMMDYLKKHPIKLTLGSGETFNIKSYRRHLRKKDNLSNHLRNAFVEHVSFTDITNLLKGKSPVNKYTLSNLPSRTGYAQTGRWPQDTGSFGAWVLTIVYENKDEPLEKTRNINVYGGRVYISGNKKTINLKNFRTPSIAPNGVDAKLSIFASDGDRGVGDDNAVLINQDGQKKYLGTKDDFFRSTIKNVPNRNPKYENNFGIDIQNFNVGTSVNINNPIKEKQSSAKLELSSYKEDVVVSTVGFTTELYRPKLCYDYDLVLGDGVKVPTDTSLRDIDTSSYGKDLTMRVFLRSELSDFDFDNVEMKINWKPSTKADKINYKTGSSYVSGNNQNSYVSVPELNSDGIIPIGKLNAAKTAGVIGPLESTYTKQNFEMPNGSFKGTFDISINGTITYNSDLIDYNLSTSGKGLDKIELCDTNPVYNPVWGQFNVERTDSDVSQPDNIRYPLYTQITGRDFNVDITSYKKDGAGKFTVPNVVNTIVEVDLIDASLFKNLGDTSGYNVYDSSCENPEVFAGSAMVRFNNQDRVRVNVPSDFSNFNNDLAKKSVAFRVWYLGTYDNDHNFNVVQHTCDFTSTCFQSLYASDFASKDTNGYCLNDCSISYNAKKCYSCLREYFSKPTCSRDNFAIRPASFRMKIADNNEVEPPASGTDNFIVLNETGNSKKLAAEYEYKADIVPVNYLNETLSNDYYNFNYEEENNITVIDPLKEYVLLESVNTGTCVDNSHKAFGYHFIDSKIATNTKFEHNNVGLYNLYMNDNTWTEVDQAGYAYKPVFGGISTSDCVQNSSDNPASGIKPGCNFTSYNQANFEKINLQFNPYKFSFDGVEFKTIPWGALMMTDFENPYYDSNDITVASKFEGSLSAIGKKDTVLTNFTKDCLSEDIELEVARKTFPDDEADLESIRTSGTTKDVFFQQYLKLVNSADVLKIGMDKNVTIPSNEFNNTDAGKAPVELFMTFKKPLDGVVQPIRATFETLVGKSPNASSYAHMNTNYIPGGYRDYNATVDYFFSKITPYKTLFGPTVEDVIETPLSVDLYCTDRTDITCEEFGLTRPTVGMDEDQYEWYVADVFGVNELGLYDLTSSIIEGTNVEKVKSTETNTATGLDFNDPIAVQKDIEVSLTNAITAPTTVQVLIEPEPWLLYDEIQPDGYPSFKVKFIPDTAWSGVGNTGQVVGGTSDKNSKRNMHW